MTGQELTVLFGKNIKNLRNSHEWSQEQLAVKMELSVNSICEIENGKSFVRAETLAGFAVLFKTEVYEFFKPEDILPDNAAGVLAKYCDDVAKASEKIKKEYLKKIK